MFEARIADILELPTSWRQQVRRTILFALQAIESLAVEEAPHRTGNLVNAIQVEQTATGGRIFVGPGAPYARFVHEGTGLFGPRRQPIRPRVKRALFWEGARHPVAQVRGARPNPFMDRAAERARPEIVALFRRLGGEV
jgi:HK97 gp10 family phage protein